MKQQDASSSDCGDQKEPVKQLKTKRQSEQEWNKRPENVRPRPRRAREQMTMMLESPSSSSASKSESPVKDGTKLTTVIKANGTGAKYAARKSWAE